METTLSTAAREIKLTNRQKEILNFLHENYLITNKEIAQQLNLSEKGIRHHMTAMNKVFGTPNRFRLLEEYRRLVLDGEGKVL